jgi:ketosteroid isomerase-like protein
VPPKGGITVAVVTPEDLVTLEEIRQLKYRYLRAVDTKDWDLLASTFTQDGVADYGTPAMGKPLVLTGRDAIVGFMRDNLGPGIITVHAAGQPEITLDGDTATGMWCFQDTVIAAEHKVVIQGAAFYEDTYRRDTDGTWRISRTGYQRTYEVTFSVKDVPSFQLTANRWAA